MISRPSMTAETRERLRRARDHAERKRLGLGELDSRGRLRGLNAIERGYQALDNRLSTIAVSGVPYPDQMP